MLIFKGLLKKDLQQFKNNKINITFNIKTYIYIYILDIKIN